jgi:hypothetical protein
MKKDKETIKMVEETFIRKHAKKILIAGAIVTTAGLVYITKKHGIELNIVKNKLAEASNIALRSLYREKADAEFEIATLKEYINNLDSNIKINIFENIPKAKARIAELEVFIREIDMDINRIEG